MRLSASRIRSINRAIARVQSSAWSTPNKNHRHLIPNLAPAVSVSGTKFVKIVSVPRSEAS